MQARPSEPASSNNAVIGWVFVAAQAVLLGALILLPSRADWPTPPWFRTTGWIVMMSGFVVMAAAALRLGTALTPTPVPSGRGALTTTGLYRFVRHPIYTGVLLIVVGLTMRSGSWISLVVGVVTVVFFDRKANWEEARLAETFDGYAEYASRTPRFVPGLRPRGRP